MKLNKTLWVILFFFSTILTACVSQTPHESNNLPPTENALQPKEVNHTSSKLINEILGWAGKGMVKDCPFNALDSTMEQVKSEWGEPDTVDTAGFGFYAAYNKKNIVLGYNKG